MLDLQSMLNSSSLMAVVVFDAGWR